MTAPMHSDQVGRNGTWHVLAELRVPSEPGNERLATERVARVVKGLGLSEQRLERLKTAVAEATMNAMEHGNQYRPQVPVIIEMLSSGADMLVRINDQGGSLVPDPEGNEFRAERGTVALCRCGGSMTKPFCDGTHSKVGFRAAQRAVREEVREGA